VLNILSNAATGASREGEFRVMPAVLTLDAQNSQRTVQVKLMDANGLNAKKTPITLTFDSTPPPGISVGKGPFGNEPVTFTGNSATVSTEADGTLSLLIQVDPAKLGSADSFLTLKGSAALDKAKAPVEFTLPMKLAKLLPAAAAGQAALTPANSSISLKGGTPHGNPVQGVVVTVNHTSTTLMPASNPPATTNAQGVATFNASTSNTGADIPTTVTFKAPGYADATVSITEQKP
jgi:hypothetical protein